MKLSSFCGMLLLGLSALLPARSYAQDSTLVFPIEAYLRHIAFRHPVARQGQLLADQAKQEIRLARGAFDPVASTYYYNKELYGKNYFTLWDNVLKVPLWIGELKGGYERNSGINVNGENITPPEGLTYLGISVPLGQGLLLDERRATVQLARQAQNLALADQVKLINKLFLEAAKAYWDWAFTYHRLKLLEQSQTLAEIRLKAVTERVEQGDLAAIDVVEAEMEAQNRMALLIQARVDNRNAALVASNFLWGEDNTPLEITDNMVPSLEGAQTETMTTEDLQELLQAAHENHPELQKLEVKLRQLDIERRFSQNKLLPKLNLEYNIIGPGGSMGRQWTERTYISDNYKVGANFSFPLFLRQERSKLQITKLKVMSAQLDLQQTNRETMNQVRAAYNDRQQLEEQIALQEQIVANASKLLVGEQRRFENGESSLFLLNSREISLLNQQVKLYELQTKYGKSKYYLQWTAGLLGPAAR